MYREPLRGISCFKAQSVLPSEKFAMSSFYWVKPRMFMLSFTSQRGASNWLAKINFLGRYMEGNSKRCTFFNSVEYPQI